jgi:hypothetical protein
LIGCTKTIPGYKLSLEEREQLMQEDYMEVSIYLIERYGDTRFNFNIEKEKSDGFSPYKIQHYDCIDKFLELKPTYSLHDNGRDYYCVLDTVVYSEKEDKLLGNCECWFK